jgi:hypothetical protein
LPGLLYFKGLPHAFDLAEVRKATGTHKIDLGRSPAYDLRFERIKAPPEITLWIAAFQRRLLSIMHPLPNSHLDAQVGKLGNVTDRWHADASSPPAKKAQIMDEKLPAPCEPCHGSGLHNGSECAECGGKGYRMFVNGRPSQSPRERPKQWRGQRPISRR